MSSSNSTNGETDQEGSDALDDDIKRAYKQLALRYHPDKNINNVDNDEIFKAINRAHAVLSDPHKRRIYDIYSALGVELDHEFDNDDAIVELEKLLVQLFDDDDDEIFGKPWQKWIYRTCKVVSCYFFGFYCCCGFGCLCCCNFCCGQCVPDWATDDENSSEKVDDVNESTHTDSDQNDDEPTTHNNGPKMITHQPKLSDASRSHPIRITNTTTTNTADYQRQSSRPSPPPRSVLVGMLPSSLTGADSPNTRRRHLADLARECAAMARERADPKANADDNRIQHSSAGGNAAESNCGGNRNYGYSVFTVSGGEV